MNDKSKQAGYSENTVPNQFYSASSHTKLSPIRSIEDLTSRTSSLKLNHLERQRNSIAFLTNRIREKSQENEQLKRMTISPQSNYSNNFFSSTIPTLNQGSAYLNESINLLNQSNESQVKLSTSSSTSTSLSNPVMKPMHQCLEITEGQIKSSVSNEVQSLLQQIQKLQENNQKLQDIYSMTEASLNLHISNLQEDIHCYKQREAITERKLELLFKVVQDKEFQLKSQQQNFESSKQEDESLIASLKCQLKAKEALIIKMKSQFQELNSQILIAEKPLPLKPQTEILQNINNNNILKERNNNQKTIQNVNYSSSTTYSKSPKQTMIKTFEKSSENCDSQLKPSQKLQFNPPKLTLNDETKVVERTNLFSTRSVRPFEFYEDSNKGDKSSVDQSNDRKLSHSRNPFFYQLLHQPSKDSLINIDQNKSFEQNRIQESNKHYSPKINKVSEHLE